MFRIRRFGVLRTATVVALLYLVAFALLIIPFIVILLATGPRGGAMPTAAIIAGLLFALVIYPVVGWVLTAIACLIYNLVARWVGGIEVEVERVHPAGPPAGYAYGTPYGQPPWPTPQPQQPPWPTPPEPQQPPWPTPQERQEPPAGPPPDRE